MKLIYPDKFKVYGVILRQDVDYMFGHITGGIFILNVNFKNGVYREEVILNPGKDDPTLFELMYPCGFVKFKKKLMV